MYVIAIRDSMLLCYKGVRGEDGRLEKLSEFVG